MLRPPSAFCIIMIPFVLHTPDPPRYSVSLQVLIEPVRLSGLFLKEKTTLRALDVNM
jgi:hypothetical protein